MGTPPATRLGRAFNDWTPGGACRLRVPRKKDRRVKTVPLQDTPRKALCGHGLDGTTHLVNSHSRFLCAYFFWSRFRLSGQLLILWDLNNYAAERTVYDNKEYISVLTGSSFCAGLMFSKGQPTPNSLLRAERWEPWSDMRRYVRQLLWGTVCLFHALFLNGRRAGAEAPRTWRRCCTLATR